MSRPLRLAFMGTPVLARTILARLADLAGPDWSVVGVVAQPDKPSGRNLQLQPPPVKVEAMARGFPILQPERARDLGFIEAIREWSPDIIVVAAYGQILPQALLDVPPHGCINVHTSLLPRWRGAAPIQWAIAEGDPETGVCLMRMEAGLDTGPVLATARTPIHPDDTSAMLHDRLANLGAELLVQGLPRIASGQLQPVPQPAEGVTYARKISREDGRIDWNQPAEAVARRARAFSPWPGSFCTFTSPNSHGFSILKVHVMDVVHGQPGAAGEVVASSKDGTVVACACDAIRLVEVQPEGGRRMPAHAFMAGHAVLRFQ